MASTSPRVRLLLDWCSENNIWIDPALLICDNNSSVSVYATRAIDRATTVVKVPKQCILSARSCRFSSELLEFSSKWAAEAPNLVLALALLTEMHLGQTSRWSGYLQSLPQSIHIASLWSTFDDYGKAAAEWLQGTEAAKLIDEEKILDHLSLYFEQVAKPLLTSKGMVPRFDDMVHAYSLVSSRAFHVDLYHGISLVPVADAFNHAEDHHVHLETDYFVCPQCGSLFQCLHDEDLGEKHPRYRWSPSAEHVYDDICEMVANAAVAGSEAIFNTEVFNTYDSRLGNAQLLCHYGFILEANTNDRISWSDDTDVYDLVLRASSPSAAPFPPSRSHSKLKTVHSIFTKYRVLLSSFDSDLIYWPVITTHVPANLITTSSAIRQLSLDKEKSTESVLEYDFSINADGAISVDLLVYLFACLVVCLKPYANESESEYVESSWVNFVQMVKTAGNFFADETDQISVLGQHMSHLVQVICTARLHQMYSPSGESFSALELGELLDHVPQDQRVVRLAMEYALSERVLIESCLLRWKELGGENDV